MNDSELLPKIVGWVRQTAAIVGFLCFGAGIAYGLVYGDFAVGAWLLVLGIGLLHGSSAGRPVFINVFQEMEQSQAPAPKARNVHDGYL